jgi:alpha-L-fucosidase
MKLPLPAAIAMITISSTLPCVHAEATADRMAWFDDARFGLFIHWGVYAVPAGEWQGKQIPGIGEWIMKNGKIPVVDYKAFAKDFTAEKYDPAAWAKLAKDAGMKYIVITSKHHDGFALYDSEVTDWDVMASPARRDLLAPLAEAARKEGLKFGLYYSQAQDWTHPGGAKLGDGKDWDPAHTGNYDTYLASIALPQVKEIVERYRPDILWWDTPRDMTPERVKPFADFMAQHPLIINNNRLGQGFAGDTKTPEQHIPPRGYPGERFEVCMTMNDTWGFKKNDHNWKSVRQILRNLSDISSKGGNFLLNVGPTADGQIPPESVERLQAVGQWMKINGEAIHGTQAGPFPRRLPWGRVTSRTASDGATTLYAHVWEWPADGHILLPTLAGQPLRASILANGLPAVATATTDGLDLKLPGSAPDPDVSVVRIDFAGPVTVTQEPFVQPDNDGVLILQAADANAHGTHAGNIQLRNSGPDAYLADWTNPAWYLEYLVKTDRAGQWKLSAELAAKSAVKLTVEAAKRTWPAEIPATGGAGVWKQVDLGTIELPAGEVSIALKPVAEGWSDLEVRTVHLAPAEQS